MKVNGQMCTWGKVSPPNHVQFPELYFLTGSGCKNQLPLRIQRSRPMLAHSLEAHLEVKQQCTQWQCGLFHLFFAPFLVNGWEIPSLKSLYICPAF